MDDVDLESLQAQIDVSMSFAHDLVTSWIKPNHLSKLGLNGANASLILEEDIRRPPRLGVGAPIPSTSALTHDASKLKRRLAKRNTKGDGPVDLQPPEPGDEEHKGRPSKRKMKVDPFTHGGGRKKRKRDPETNSCPSTEDVSEHSTPLLKSLSVGEPKDPNSSSRKERQRTEQDSLNRYCKNDAWQSSKSVPSPLIRLSTPTAVSSSQTISNLEPSRKSSVPVPENPSPGCNRIRANSMHFHDIAKSLPIPLLNLDGIPELAHKPGSASESRKRRRRRKKKKTGRHFLGTRD